ncbi:MAG: hypothetical protein ACI398_09450, partial [Clostridium sp.]
MNKKKITRLLAAGIVLSTTSNIVSVQAVKAVDGLDLNSEHVIKSDAEEQNDEKAVKENENNMLVTRTTGAAVEGISWTFDDSNEGWNYNGSWDYSGDVHIVEHNSDLQALSLEVDYSKDSQISWSEFKINTKLSEVKSLA